MVIENDSVTTIKSAAGGQGGTRRNFLITSALAAASPLLHKSRPAVAAMTDASDAPSRPVRQPNILMVISDQFRSDFICAASQNSMALTPNLDAMYRRGTVFQNAMTNQPLCSPSRACLFTGQYATQTGLWRLQLGLRPDAVTLGTLLGKAGYSTNYIGKWHLAPNPGRKGKGPVPPEYRYGFTGFWLAANVPEVSTKPYDSQFWDNAGNPVHYGEDVYRVDFLTDQAETFLRQKHDKPFFLVLSQLEPHQQNGSGFVPPRGFAEKLRNPYVPPDLRPLPGDWPHTLNKYYGDCKAIDDSMGRIFKTLKEQNLDQNTIVMFLSDHGCHFRTRNTEYKRSPHDSSIHIPLMIQGPGFDNSRTIPQLVNIIDVAPTLLDAAGAPIPDFMMGHSLLPLVHDPAARAAWPEEVFVQISESETGRALRTPEWTYVALAPGVNSAHSMRYQDYQLYNNRADPAQLFNMCGRVDPPGIVHYIGDRSMRQITAHLRQRLIQRMVEAGEPRPKIDAWNYYP